MDVLYECVERDIGDGAVGIESVRVMAKSIHEQTDVELEEYLAHGAQIAAPMYEAAQREFVRRAYVKIGEGTQSVAEKTGQLCDLIGRFDRSSTKLTKWMLGLTVAVGLLALVQVIIAYLAYCNS